MPALTLREAANLSMLIEQGSNSAADPQVTLGPGLAIHGDGLLQVTGNL